MDATISCVDGMQDWEREKILEVLQRNNKLKELDQRRVHQLAVRVQIERMSDERMPQLERKLRFKTGVWHSELVQQKIEETEKSSNEDERRLAAIYRQLSSSYADSPNSSRTNSITTSNTAQQPELLEKEIPQQRVREWLSSIRDVESIKNNQKQND